MTELIDLRDLGEVTKRRLAEVGVVDLETLLSKGRDAAARQSLGREAGLNLSLLRDWVRVADLLRIPEIEVEQANALVDVGLSTVRTLADTSVDLALTRLTAAGLLEVPTAETVAAWIAAAGALDVVVELPEDGGAGPDWTPGELATAGAELEQDERWGALYGLGLEHLAIAAGDLAGQQPPRDVGPLPLMQMPEEVRDATDDQIQEVLDAMAASPELDLGDDFLSVVTPADVRASFDEPAMEITLAADLSPRSLHRWATAAEMLTVGARGQARRGTDGSLPTLDGIERVLVEQEQVHDGQVEALRSELAGDAAGLSDLVRQQRAAALVSLDALGRVGADIEALGDPTADLARARLMLRVERLRRDLVLHATFASIVEMRRLAGRDTWGEAARDLPRAELPEDVGVSELGGRTSGLFRVVGLLTALGGRGGARVRLRDIEDAATSIEVRLPEAFAWQPRMYRLPCCALLVDAGSGGGGGYRAVRRRELPESWDRLVATQVERVLPAWPGGVEVALWPARLEAPLVSDRVDVDVEEVLS